MNKMSIINVREEPMYKERAVDYFQSKWANDKSMAVYEPRFSKKAHWYVKKRATSKCAFLRTKSPELKRVGS
jgi:hypothetical protein